MSVSWDNLDRKKLIIIIPILLSGFTHLWNPVGFPDLFFDEGVYMRRAVNFLETGNPQEAYLYDHPYFGQIILASFLKITGFPNSIHPDTSPQSLTNLYLIPRIFMGILAIVDTFLIYKISEKKFDTRVAFVASLFFAVMPFTWLLSRILLESLLLPFMLSSILIALHLKDSTRKHHLVIISGTLLGLAIFTKIPAFTITPLIAYLVFSNTKETKLVSLLMIPVILIPSIWLGYSMHLDQLDLFMEDVAWQVTRQDEGLGFIDYLWNIDPILLVLGTAGILFLSYRKNIFVLLWFIPSTVFLATIGYTQYFHWILILPIFCIASSAMFVSSFERFTRTRKRKLTIVFSLIIIIVGLSSTIPLIITNVSSSQFQAMSFVLNNVKNKDNFTILASPVYSWIFDNIFERKFVMLDYGIIVFEEMPSNKTLLIVDKHFKSDMSKEIQLQKIHRNTNTIASFSSSVSRFDTELYPYGNLKYNFDGHNIMIKTSP